MCGQAQATVAETDLALKRAGDLVAQATSPPQSTLDTAQADSDRAKAALASAEANCEDRRGQPFASPRPISPRPRSRSPIDGVVLPRDVEPGQTVASSLPAPICSRSPRT